MVGGKTGLKCHAEQAGIVPSLALIVDIQDKFFLGDAGGVFKGPDAAFAFPDAKQVCAGHGGKAD